MPDGYSTKKRGLINKDVPADGSCFFSSVGSLLYLSSHNEHERSGKDLRRFCKNLRREVAEEVLKNCEKYKFHLEEEVGCSPEKYASLIVQPNVWGGYVDAAILSALYKVNIIILALDSRTGEFFTLKIGNHIDSIAVQFEREHYNYLLTEDGEVHLNLEEINFHGETWKAAQRALRERSKIKSKASEVCEVSSDESELKNIPHKIVVNKSETREPPPYQREPTTLSQLTADERKSRFTDQTDKNLPYLNSKMPDAKSDKSKSPNVLKNSINISDQLKSDKKVTDKTSSTSKSAYYRRHDRILTNEKSDGAAKSETEKSKSDSRGELHLNLGDADNESEETYFTCESLTRSPLNNIHLWEPKYKSNQESQV